MDNSKNMTTSHSESSIYEGCISLMKELVRDFYEYLEFLGVDVANLDEDEQFNVSFNNMEIVQRLFLERTTHSGSSSTMMKMKELGIEYGDVEFNFDEELSDLD